MSSGGDSDSCGLSVFSFFFREISRRRYARCLYSGLAQIPVYVFSECVSRTRSSRDHELPPLHPPSPRFIVDWDTDVNNRLYDGLRITSRCSADVIISVNLSYSRNIYFATKQFYSLSDATQSLTLCLCMLCMCRAWSCMGDD